MIFNERLNCKKNAKSIPKFFNSFTFSLHGQILGGGTILSCLKAKYSDACGSVKKTKEALELAFAFSFT